MQIFKEAGADTPVFFMPKTVLIAVAILAIFNFSRIFISLTIANLSKARKIKNRNKHYGAEESGISIVIPAYNEEKDIVKCVESVYSNSITNKEVIVVDDGSYDSTRLLLKRLKTNYPDLIVVHQKNSGKATALNNGIKNYASFDLVMVLDGDSSIDSHALQKMMGHFSSDKRLIAVAANVMIEHPQKRVKKLNVVEYAQKLEYLIGNKYKEAEPSLNLEYIIGGIGSTFRREALLDVGGYSTDSVTEDIDLSMKLISAFGNKSAHIDYADDVICFTPPAHNFSDLRKQRLRWKYGRFKALMKYKDLFFSTRLEKYSFTLTWWKLPKIVFFEEIMMLLDPFLLAVMIYLLILYFDVSTVIGTVVVYFFVSMISVLSANELSRRERTIMVATSPLTIFLLYIINIADFFSLIICITRYKEIVFNTNQLSKWNHIER